MANEERFIFDEYLKPIWRGDIIYNESVTMVKDSDMVAEAVLLFDPVEIISVKNAHLDILYQENIDWILENGKLKLTENSSAVYLC